MKKWTIYAGGRQLGTVNACTETLALYKAMCQYPDTDEETLRAEVTEPSLP